MHVFFIPCTSKMVELEMVTDVEMRTDLDSILWQCRCSFVPDIHPNHQMHCNVNWINQILDWLHWLHTKWLQSKLSPVWNSFFWKASYYECEYTFFDYRLLLMIRICHSIWSLKSVSKISQIPMISRESWLILHRIVYGNEQNSFVLVNFYTWVSHVHKIECKLFKFWFREQEREREKHSSQTELTDHINQISNRIYVYTVLQ